MAASNKAKADAAKNQANIARQKNNENIARAKNGANNAGTPTNKVSGLKITRTKDSFKAEWKVPSDAVNTTDKNKKAKRFTSLVVKCRIDETGVAAKKEPKDQDSIKNEKATSDTFSLAKFDATSPKKATYTRADFYPCTKKSGSKTVTGQKVDALIVTVCGKNSHGTGPTATAKYEFALPDAPKASFSYNEDNGVVTLTVTSPERYQKKDRYDTLILAKVTVAGKVSTLLDWASTDKVEYRKDWDTGSYSVDIAAGKTVKFEVWAYCRGLKGDNPTKANALKKPLASIVVARPHATKITSITTTSMNDSGSIKVNVSVGARAKTIQLQRRHGDDGSWEDVDGAKDNGTCKSLYDSVGLADPKRGEKLWYRVVSKRDNFTVVSDAFWAECLYIEPPSKTSSTCKILSLEPADNGESAVAVIGWSGTASGIEVSWSTDPNAWESTSEPEKFECTWEDAKSKDATGKWPKTLTIYIRGLSIGSTYYVRARGFLDDDEAGRIWMMYDQAENVVSPAARALSVTLSADSTVERGNPITLMWSVDGDSEQTEYHVRQAGSTQDYNGLAGSGQVGTATVTPAMYGDADSLSFVVAIGTGGDLTLSNSVTVQIADRPSISIGVPATLTGQPAAFELYSADMPATAICACLVGENGNQWTEPDGDREQFEGDAVWASVEKLEWTATTWEGTVLHGLLAAEVDAAAQEVASASPQELEEAQAAYARAQAAYNANKGSINVATVTLPTGVDLLDNGGYVITATATDAATGLSSDRVSGGFRVAWAHQAPVPPDGITALVDKFERSAKLILKPPSGAASGDVYDVYRGSVDGFELIASGLALDAVITDRYATFSDGDIAYRVCCRTADGDIAFSDVYYRLDVDSLRFDWPGGYAEPERNLRFSNSFKKDFEARGHMNGKVNGYWNGIVTREGTFNATVIDDYDGAVRRAVLDMARYPNAVFCRTYDGQAFQCNVDVSDSYEHLGMLTDFTFSITEVALSDTFRIGAEDIAGALEAGGAS